MSELAGTTVMITGASRGLGRALALAFASAGAQVSVCARSADALEGLSEELQSTGIAYVSQAVDITNADAVERWVEGTCSGLGDPTVLINNASVLGPRLPLTAIEANGWRNVLDANLNGTFYVTRAVAPRMVEAGKGSIINVSSGASIPPRVNWGAYAISKSAVDALSSNLAAELAGTGVRVNLVDPGAMRTAMRADAYPAEDPLSLKEANTIAPLFIWLATDASAGVSGKRFQADEWLRQNSVATT